ncbi:MAG: CBS domain-containing protein [Rhodoferax sp.]|jgi:acetoin utilization protein AcuB|nr:CBS domain-containing protein [Rhodoferax sp.]
MFAAYGVSGQVFRGTLEEMQRVNGLERVRSARPHDREDDSWPLHNLQATAPGAPNEKAVRAYRAMLPREIERGPLYHAGQIMQRKVVCVQVNDDVEKAWRTLRSHNIKQAPVMDDASRLVGMVGEHDLLVALQLGTASGIELLAKRIGDVMRTPVITAEAVTDIRRIATAMLTNNLDGVPVTAELGRLVGYVSRTDILRAVVADPPLSLWR